MEPDQLRIDICRSGLAELMGCKTGGQHQPEKTIVLEIPMQLRRRGIEAKLIIGNQSNDVAEPDPALIKLVTDANTLSWSTKQWQLQQSCRAIQENRKSSTEISRVLPLAFLAPDITRAIISGQQPAELTTQMLKRTKPLPADWSKQRQILGFTPAE